jgi:hypothetical protein
MNSYSPGSPSHQAPTISAPPAMMPQQAPAPAAGMGMNAPAGLTPPPGPLPTPPKRYPTGRAVGVNPVEPWRDSLRLWMFVWGALTLAAFATPLKVDPLVFGWDAILHGSGTPQLLALIVPSIGLLSIIVAALPMPSLARGMIAAVLGLTGVLLPWVLTAFPEWQQIVLIIGTLALVPGLIARHEYREAFLPRLLVTIGVLATLAPLLIPDHGEIPLVALVKGLIDLPGAAKVLPLVGGVMPNGAFVPGLVLVVIVVMSLLAWMPAPATGGGNAFAWIVIVWPFVALLAVALASGAIGVVISKTPGVLMLWAPGSAFLVLVGFGVATVIGKQLE